MGVGKKVECRNGVQTPKRPACSESRYGEMYCLHILERVCLADEVRMFFSETSAPIYGLQCDDSLDCGIEFWVFTWRLSHWNTIATNSVNLLNPTGHVMHQQFNIQQLYALPTLYLCVLYLSENKQRLVPLTA
jgi:hypothetical protein